jgi:hypothetical protein
MDGLVEESVCFVILIQDFLGQRQATSGLLLYPPRVLTSVFRRSGLLSERNARGMKCIRPVVRTSNSHAYIDQTSRNLHTANDWSMFLYPVRILIAHVEVNRPIVIEIISRYCNYLPCHNTLKVISAEAAGFIAPAVQIDLYFLFQITILLFFFFGSQLP